MIINYEILSKKNEYFLIKEWQTNNNKNALDKIIKAYRRMPESYARRFSKYGVSKEDLVNEGIIGLIYAIDKFDIKKQLRLATYASWWIKASMQTYILKNWSIVKMPSSASYKALFFGLNRIKNKICVSKVDHDFLSHNHTNKIAKSLSVKPKLVNEVESKLALGDQSLNQTLTSDTKNELIINLLDNRPNPEDIVSAMKDNRSRSLWLQEALKILDNREKEIVERKLNDKSVTLEVMAKRIGVSKERIRQIESRAYKKLNKKLLSISGQNKDFFISN